MASVKISQNEINKLLNMLKNSLIHLINFPGKGATKEFQNVHINPNGEKITGNHDFLFQRSKTKPERLCQAVNHPSKSNMGNIIFAWNDTIKTRKQESQLIVILNDNESFSKGVKEAFYSYDTKVILWSERNRKENLDLLSA